MVSTGRVFFKKTNCSTYLPFDHSLAKTQMHFFFWIKYFHNFTEFDSTLYSIHSDGCKAQRIKSRCLAKMSPNFLFPKCLTLLIQQGLDWNIFTKTLFISVPSHSVIGFSSLSQSCGTSQKILGISTPLHEKYQMLVIPPYSIMIPYMLKYWWWLSAN